MRLGLRKALGEQGAAYLDTIDRELNREAHADRWAWWKVRGPVQRKTEIPRCGASTRAGRPCRAPAWRPKSRAGAHWPVRNGRCRMHGGKSTGPRTPEGKARCRAAAVVNLELARAALARKRAGGEVDNKPGDTEPVDVPTPAAPAPPRPLTVEERRAADAAEHLAAVTAGRPSPFRFRDNAGNWRR